MGRVRRKFWHIKHWEPCIWGSFHGPRIFLFLLRVLCRLPYRWSEVKKRIQLVLNFTLCLRGQTLMTLACNRDFMKIPFKTLKEVKQACTMCGSTAPFVLGYYRMW
jgi:hypothetical protein